MTIAEKMMFDYNAVQQACVSNMSEDPVACAYKLAISTELFSSLEKRGFVTEGMYGDKLQVLLNIENIFESFFIFWANNDTEFRSIVDRDFQDFLASLE